MDESLSDDRMSIEDRICAIAPARTTCKTYFGWDGRSLGAWGGLKDGIRADWADSGSTAAFPVQTRGLPKAPFFAINLSRMTNRKPSSRKDRLSASPLTITRPQPSASALRKG